MRSCVSFFMMSRWLDGVFRVSDIFVDADFRFVRERKVCLVLFAFGCHGCHFVAMVMEMFEVQKIECVMEKLVVF